MSTQFSFLVPAVSSADYRPKQVVDLMSRNWFSLAKERTKPIIHKAKHGDGEMWVEITPASNQGIATVWDEDVLIFAVAKKVHEINQTKRSAVSDAHISSEVIFTGPEFYNYTQRNRNSIGGKQYQQLWSSIQRLKGTLVRTNIRQGNQTRSPQFNWLSYADQHIKDGKHLGFRVDLPPWIMEPLMQPRPHALTLNPEYFRLSGGVERWLYLYARKAGGSNPDGWVESAQLIYEKTAVDTPFKVFWHRIIKLLKARGGAILEYDVTVETKGRQRFLRFTRNKYMPRSFTPPTIEHQLTS